MASFCTQCGKELNTNAEICSECSAKNSTPVAQTFQQRPVPPNTDTKPVSTGGYFGLIFLFSLPVVGFVICIITALAVKNKNIKNFAKAMLIWTVIGIVLTAVIVGIFVLLADTLVPYLNEVTGGEITEFEEAFRELNQLKEEFEKLESSGVLENVTNKQKF